MDIQPEVHDCSNIDLYVKEWLRENVVNPYWKMRERNMNSPEFGFVITELQLTYEVLWMAQGVENLFVFYWNGESYGILPGLQLTHLSEKALNSLLRPVCHYGTILRRMRKFISVTSKSTSCLTYQAYSTMLSLIINDTLRHISQLEANFTKNYGCKLMQEVLKEVEFVLSDLDEIYSVHTQGVEMCSEKSCNWEKVSNLIMCLYKHLIDVDSVNFSRKYKMLLNLFMSTIRPLLDFVESLITKPITLDPAQEFFVVRKDKVLKDENYWNNTLSMRSIPDIFLSSILPDVLLAGKSTDVVTKFAAFEDCKVSQGYSLFHHFKENLLKVLIQSGNIACQEQPAKLPSPHPSNLLLHFETVFPKGDILMKENFSQLLSLSANVKTENWSDCNMELDLNLHSMNIGSLYPLQLHINHCLFPLVQQLCTDANHKLLSVLRQNQLTDHLNVFRKYFLMESGEVMLCFSHHLFEKLYCGEELNDSFELNALLQGAITQFHPNENNSLYIVATNFFEMDVPKLLQDLTKVNLYYEVPWPACMLLNSHCIDVHQKIFTVILQIKCAKHSLDKLLLKDLKTELVEDTNMSEKEVKEPSGEAKQQVMFLMRMKLLHFINSLHGHFMMNNLHSTSVVLEKKLEQACNFQEMQEIYEKHLQQLKQSCLLEDSQRFLRQLVLKALTLCINFSKCWRQGVHTTKASELFAIDDVFNKYQKFLSTVMTMLQKRNLFYVNSLSFALLCQEKNSSIVPKSWERLGRV